VVAPLLQSSLAFVLVPSSCLAAAVAYTVTAYFENGPIRSCQGQPMSKLDGTPIAQVRTPLLTRGQARVSLSSRLQVLASSARVHANDALRGLAIRQSRTATVA